jgi:hypothetical protein
MTHDPDLRALTPDFDAGDYEALFDDEVAPEVLDVLLARVRTEPGAARIAARFLYTDALLDALRCPRPVATATESGTRMRAAVASSPRHSRVQPAVAPRPSRWVALASVSGLAAAGFLMAVGFVAFRSGPGDPVVEQRLRDANRLREVYVGQWLEEHTRTVATAGPARKPERAAPATLRHIHVGPGRPPDPPAAEAPSTPATPEASEIPPPAGTPRKPATPSEPPPAAPSPPAPRGFGTRSSVVVATVREARGDVYTLIDGRTIPVLRNQKLLSGQQIQTGSGDSRAVIAYPDGTRAELGPVTAVSLLDPCLAREPGQAGFDKGLFLFEGTAELSVARQPAGRPMILVTPHSRVDVLGTTLTLRESFGSTRVEVLRGLVRTTRRSDRVQTLVRAGEFVVAAPGVSLTPKPLATDRLVLWLPFDEETGNLAFDASGNGAHARRTGGKWRPRGGRLGGAIDLDGRTDHLWCPDYPKPASQMTCTAWVFARSRSTWATILKNWSAPTHGQIHFGLQEMDGDLECGIREADGGEVRLREGASRPFPLNRWQHVAFVADGTCARLYRNGTQVDAATYDGTLDTAFKPLAIGMKTNAEGTGPLYDGPGTMQRWNGLIDDVRIYNRALTGAEIRACAAERRRE